MTFLSDGGLAIWASSVLLTSWPIPNETTFVPTFLSELPVVTRFSKSASGYNVHHHHHHHHHHHRHHRHPSSSVQRILDTKLQHKVIDFDTNQKHVCDFLLARNSNLGLILHRFGDMVAFMCSWPHPYSTLILGVFPLHQIAHVGVNVSWCFELFSREIISEVFQPMWSRYLNITDGQTNGRLYILIITLCAVKKVLGFKGFRFLCTT